jgi:hypothetical protein
MPSIPLKISGGIGDCLLEISRFPIKILGSMGIGIEFYYTLPDHPASAIIKEFIPFIEKASVSLDSLPQNLNRHRLANLSGRIFQKTPIFFKPPLLGFEKQNPIQKNIKILIQTHMDGHHNLKCFSAKMWTIQKWIEYVHLTLQIPNAEVRILEWDAEAISEFRRDLPGIQIISPKDLHSSIREVHDSDVLVSVDSWTKYVARWFNKKQIIILPDLRNNYTPYFKTISADQVVRRWFFGIAGRTNVKIIGAEKSGGTFQYTLDQISNLQPDYLYEETKVIASN